MASVGEFAAESVASIKTIFEQWDHDGNGTIDRDELSRVMFQLTTNLTAADIDTLLNEVDLDGNGVISFDEFVAWLVDPSSKQTIGTDGWLEELDLDEVFRPLFKVFDKNNDGAISVDEFQECAQP
mmetsp:Transcript_77313/g.136419  ORF Transcript_77313/g.136419 Transcript_77313/m.136419 type:complete len:126 (-) Transcript_77313:52-429(-)